VPQRELAAVRGRVPDLRYLAELALWSPTLARRRFESAQYEEDAAADFCNRFTSIVHLLDRRMPEERALARCSSPPGLRLNAKARVMERLTTPYELRGRDCMTRRG
jgi:hypothetical protein